MSKNKKLKRRSAGDYIYDDRFLVQNFGYDRICGHVRWNVWDIVDDNAPSFQTDTLKEAVQMLKRKYDGRV